jgi:hypothetical protein
VIDRIPPDVEGTQFIFRFLRQGPETAIKLVVSSGPMFWHRKVATLAYAVESYASGRDKNDVKMSKGHD